MIIFANTPQFRKQGQQSPVISASGRYLVRFRSVGVNICIYISISKYRILLKTATTTVCLKRLRKPWNFRDYIWAIPDKFCTPHTEEVSASYAKI